MNGIMNGTGMPTGHDSYALGSVVVWYRLVPSGAIWCCLVLSNDALCGLSLRKEYVVDLHFKDSYLDLSHTEIMGTLDLDPTVHLSTAEIVAAASDFAESGATFIEFSVGKFLPKPVADEIAINILCDAISALKSEPELPIPAVYTSSPAVMKAAVDAGARFIVDPLALRAPGALEMAARLDCALCLLYDQTVLFAENDGTDPCGTVSEFFYERIDACLNAKIERRRLILDPMISINTSMEYRLKMMGRFKSLTSFGLPLSCELPRAVADNNDANTVEGLNRNLTQEPSIVTAVSLFLEQQGVRLIRTKSVYDLALGLDTWHALNRSARPFKLTRAIGKTIRRLAKKKAKSTAQ